LWERYKRDLLRLARRKLEASGRRVADEDDLVNVVFYEAIRGIQERTFDRLHHRGDLRQILNMLTDRKAADQRRRETAQRVGSGRVRGDSALENVDSSANSMPPGIAKVPRREPTAESAVLVVDRLEQLGDDALRKVVIAKAAGYTNREISDELGMSLRTVERKLELARKIWQQEA